MSKVEFQVTSIPAVDSGALSLIEQLLKTPGAVDSVSYSITPNDLKYRWEWDPLRKDPRFQKLIAQNASPQSR